MPGTGANSRYEKVVAVRVHRAMYTCMMQNAPRLSRMDGILVTKRDIPMKTIPLYNRTQEECIVTKGGKYFPEEVEYYSVASDFISEVVSFSGKHED